jgi:anti-sigma regulatory factor (Ser/Thr protein kinase)
MTPGPPCWVRELSLPATPASVSKARRWVERLAAEGGLSDGRLFEFVFAASEALANAVTHGSPGGEQNQINVLFSRLPEAVSIEISDQGEGFESSPVCVPDALAGEGRGIAFIRSLTDEAEFECGPTGTRVRLVMFCPPRD